MLQSLLFTATRTTQNFEARRVLDDVSNRISAMAAAQRVLYASGTASRISAAEFLDAVCHAAQQSFLPTIEIVREVVSGELDNDDAMPLALILNELLTNAAKHGCKEGAKSQIRVGLTNRRGLELYVEDDGSGFDLNSVMDQSSGLKLVQLLARQVRGQLEVSRRPASRCTLRFK
jgi:two-component sensor histidine kinase